MYKFFLKAQKKGGKLQPRRNSPVFGGKSGRCYILDVIAVNFTHIKPNPHSYGIKRPFF
jgi:hypothetical protein